ncbi:hypothetical protein ACMFMG_008147 [Clarireedia jacksonii]
MFISCLGVRDVTDNNLIAAVEAGPLGIRVNMVSPSWVATPMFTEECQRAPPTLDFIKAQVPAGRPAEVGEVAEGITFLCSSAATYINGAALIIDSGLTLTVHLAGPDGRGFSQPAAAGSNLPASSTQKDYRTTV